MLGRFVNSMRMIRLLYTKRSWGGHPVMTNSANGHGRRPYRQRLAVSGQCEGNLRYRPGGDCPRDRPLPGRGIARHVAGLRGQHVGLQDAPGPRRVRASGRSARRASAWCCAASRSPRGSGEAARRLQFGGAGHIPRFQHGFPRARRAGNSIYRTGRGARPGPGTTRLWPTGGDGAGADGTTAACRW